MMKIYFKNGLVVTTNSKFTKALRQGSSLMRLEWENPPGDDMLIFLDPSEVIAITCDMWEDEMDKEVNEPLMEAIHG